MAADFINLTVLVTLKSAPSQPFHGLVSAVQGQSLHLQNVVWPATGDHLHTFVVHGSEVADIEVVVLPPAGTQPRRPPLSLRPSQLPPLPPTAVSRHIPAHHTPQVQQSHQQQQQQTSKFVDPAILSYDRAPRKSNNVSTTPTKLQQPLFPAQANTSHELSAQTAQSALPTSTDIHGVELNSALHKSLNALGIHDGGSIANTGDLDSDVTRTAVAMSHPGRTSRAQPVLAAGTSDAADSAPQVRRTRRQQKGRQVNHIEAREINLNITDAGSSPEELRMTQPVAATAPISTYGWRQTPMTKPKKQAMPESEDGTARKAARKKMSNNRQRRRQQSSQQQTTQNGWATEDATDVQEMGDFDFEGNLSKFDKHAVFAQLRDEDTTADEDRLVSFNRVKKPGTFGGKNLHPTENVLDMPATDSFTTEDDDSEDELWNGALGSRIAERMSRTNSFRPEALVRASSTLSERSGGGAESGNGLRGNQKLSMSQQSLLASQLPKSLERRSSGSPNLSLQRRSSSGRQQQRPGGSRHQQQQQQQQHIQQQQRQQRKQHRASLRYELWERSCRTFSPQVLQHIEDIAVTELKYSDDMLSENAGRGVAEVALGVVNPGGRRIGQQNQNAQPIVVMLLGNNQAGARALVAARHLRERGVRVIACTAGSVSLTSEPLSEAWQRFGDMLRGWTETAAYLKTLDAPPELIIDALFGRTMSVLHGPDSDGDPSEIDIIIDMIRWANASTAPVLSVDIPSGIDPGSGQVNLLQGSVTSKGDNSGVHVSAKLVVCLGAPCTGVLRYLEMLSRLHWRSTQVQRARDSQSVNLNSLKEVMAGNIGGISEAETETEAWRIVVVDIGLNPAAKQYLRSVRGHDLHAISGVLGVGTEAGPGAGPGAGADDTAATTDVSMVAASGGSRAAVGGTVEKGKLVHFGTEWTARLRFDHGV